MSKDPVNKQAYMNEWTNCWTNKWEQKDDKN